MVFELFKLEALLVDRHARTMRWDPMMYLEILVDTSTSAVSILMFTTVFCYPSILFLYLIFLFVC